VVDGDEGTADPCSAVNLPYSQDFTTAIIPNMPDCTLVQNAGTGNNWTTENTTNSYGFDGTYLRYRWNSTNAANSWFYTQGLNLDSSKTYKVSYRYGGTSATFPESMKVAIGNETDRDGNSMTQIIADYPTITTTNNSTEEEFTVSTSGVYYIGFNAYSDLNEFYLYLDDILVEEIDDEEPEPGVECEQGINSLSTIPNAYNITTGNDFRSADDFIVDADGFTLNKITIDTNQQTVPNEATIFIRENAGGTPGIVLYTITGAPNSSEVVGSAFNDPIYNLTFELDTPIDLEEGTYWIDAKMSTSTGEVVWVAVTDYASSHGAYMQRSSDGGATWTLDTAFSIVFKVFGICGDEEPEPSNECDFNVPSNNFENGHGFLELVTIANDFQVQPNSTFTVNSFEFNTMELSPSTAVNLTFYENNNGAPGTIIESLPGLVPTTTNIGTAFTFPVNKHVITFDTPKVFEGGTDGTTYWISIKVTNTGNVYWESTSVLGSNFVGKISEDDGITWNSISGTWDSVMKLSGTIEGECHGEAPEPPAYTCDENFNNSNSFENGLFTGGADNQKLATDIIVGDTGFTVYGTKANILVDGNPDITFSVNFYEDNAGIPGTLYHSTNATIHESTLLGNAFGYDVYEYVINFTDNAVLDADTTYWMEIVTNGIAWEATSANIFGAGLTFNNIGTGGAWVNQVGLDLVFELVCEDLSISDLNSFDFAYYPNPVNDVLHITAKNGVENISIFNLAGQKIVSNAKVSNNQIDVTSLNSGIYVFRVTLEGGQVETFKIVKK